MSDSDLDVISPELALVSPDLRARAIALLPPIELDRLAPLPPLRPGPEPRAPLSSVVAGVAATSGIAFVSCILLVLVLTELANALR